VFPFPLACRSKNRVGGKIEESISGSRPLQLPVIDNLSSNDNFGIGICEGKMRLAYQMKRICVLHAWTSQSVCYTPGPANLCATRLDQPICVLHAWTRQSVCYTPGPANLCATRLDQPILSELIILVMFG
jgi:hypothetical protein